MPRSWLTLIKLFYLSDSDLRYKAFGKKRLLAVIALPVLLSSAITIFLVHLGFDPYGLESLQSSAASKQNTALKTKLVSVNEKLHDFQNYMADFEKSDGLLRICVELPPISSDVRKAPIGGVEENEDYGVSAASNKLIFEATQTLDVLNREAKLEEESYSDILRSYKANQSLYAHIPAIDPIRDGTINDGFGMRFHPILHIRLMHEGIDIKAMPDTPVHVTGDGVVSYVGRRGSYGNVVEVNHGFGYTTLYAHLQKSIVVVGQKVKRGQVIALSGDTGLSTGPHLHYGVTKNGVYVNPSSYYFQETQFDDPKLYGLTSRK